MQEILHTTETTGTALVLLAKLLITVSKLLLA